MYQIYYHATSSPKNGLTTAAVFKQNNQEVDYFDRVDREKTQLIGGECCYIAALEALKYFLSCVYNPVNHGNCKVTIYGSNKVCNGHISSSFTANGGAYEPHLIEFRGLLEDAKREHGIKFEFDWIGKDNNPAASLAALANE